MFENDTSVHKTERFFNIQINSYQVHLPHQAGSVLYTSKIHHLATTMISFPTFFLSLVALIAIGLPTTSDALSLQMAATSSSKTSSSKSFKPLKTSKTSSTKLYYANEATPSSTTTLTGPRTTLTKSNRHRRQQRLDPVQAIAFLNDPERKYKKRSRPRFLSDLDRERRALTKAAAKAQAQANFEFGQRAAQRAIDSVLKEHGITDACITP
jgi:hypothetical protein